MDSAGYMDTSVSKSHLSSEAYLSGALLNLESIMSHDTFHLVPWESPNTILANKGTVESSGGQTS